eukprot:4848380-Prorocentrum_lima.AAC.1
MTSSLVGSEMCIRDRPLEEPRPSEKFGNTDTAKQQFQDMDKREAMLRICLLYTSDAADDM